MNMILAWAMGLALCLAPAAKSVQSPARPEGEGGPVKWYTLEEAQAAMKKKPKKIFVDVYTDWCGWCKVMDRKTFSNPAVAKYLNENFYPVKFNAEGTDNIIFREKVYKFNAGAGAHQLAIDMLQGQLSYPTTVYLDEKLNMIQPIPGYLEAKQFDAILHFFAGNHYKKMSFEEFSKDYKSTL